MLRSNSYIEALPCFAFFLYPKLFFQKKLPRKAILAGARHVTFSEKNRSENDDPKAFCQKTTLTNQRFVRKSTIFTGKTPLLTKRTFVRSFLIKSFGYEKSYPHKPKVCAQIVDLHGPYGARQGTARRFFKASKKWCHTFTLVVLRGQLQRISSYHSLVEVKFLVYVREFINTITVNFCRAFPQIAFPQEKSKRSFASTKEWEKGAPRYTPPIWGTTSACVQNLSSKVSAPTNPSGTRHGIEKTTPNSRTIVVTSGKGGVGKTTTTANLGMSIARLGYRVALIDADIGLRNLDLLLGLENRVLYTAMDIFEGECRLDQALIRDKRLKNLSLLAISKNRQRYNVTRQKMESLVSSIASLGYSFVLIDCPAGIDVGFINAISPAQEALIVTTPEITAMRDADRVAGLLEANGIYNAKLLINRVRPDMIQRHDMMSVQDVQDVLGIPLLGAIPEDLDVIVSTNRGEPLVLRKKLTLSGIAFENAARRLIGKQDYVIDLKTPYKSFFQKMKSIFTE